MMLPGFTAEASVYQTGTHYRSAGSPTRLAGRVLPQLPIGFCMADCDFNSSDPFMATICKMRCMEGGGGGGGGTGPGGPFCRPGCSPCESIPGQPGRWRTCINRNCEDREVRCRP